jgi:hypothetical protein
MLIAGLGSTCSTVGAGDPRPVTGEMLAAMFSLSAIAANAASADPLLIVQAGWLDDWMLTGFDDEFTLNAIANVSLLWGRAYG